MLAPQFARWRQAAEHGARQAANSATGRIWSQARTKARGQTVNLSDDITNHAIPYMPMQHAPCIYVYL